IKALRKLSSDSEALLALQRTAFSSHSSRCRSRHCFSRNKHSNPLLSRFNRRSTSHSRRTRNAKRRSPTQKLPPPTCKKPDPSFCRTSRCPKRQPLETTQCTSL